MRLDSAICAPGWDPLARPGLTDMRPRVGTGPLHGPARPRGDTTLRTLGSPAGRRPTQCGTPSLGHSVHWDHRPWPPRGLWRKPLALAAGEDLVPARRRALGGSKSLARARRDHDVALVYAWRVCPARPGMVAGPVAKQTARVHPDSRLFPWMGCSIQRATRRWATRSLFGEMEWIKPIGSGHRLPLQSAEFGGIFASAASARVRAPVPLVFGRISELC